MYLKYVIKTDAKVFRLDHVFLMHPPLKFTLLPQVTGSSGVCLAMIRLAENTQCSRLGRVTLPRWLHCKGGRRD